MALKFENIRLNRFRGTFYWDIESHTKVPADVVKRLAGKKYFFTPEQTMASGSYMQVEAVKQYVIENKLTRKVKKQVCVVLIGIDQIAYIPTEIIERQLDEQEWRTMQSKVTTLVIGLK